MGLDKHQIQRQSEVFNSLRMPATIAVILSHCVVLTKQTVVDLSLDSHNIFMFWESLFWSFGPIAVAVFALISGYYFLYKYTDFGISDYLNELRKRAKSLLVPYILWNTIAYLALLGKNHIASFVGFSLGVNQQELKVLERYNLIGHIIDSIDGPLWYVQSIMILSVLSPLIYSVIRYLKWSIFPIVVLVAWGLPLDLGLHRTTVTYFILGAWLGYYKVDILSCCRKLRVFSYVTGWLYCYVRTFGADTWLFSLFPLWLFLCVIALFNLAYDIYERKPQISAWFNQFNSASFFMYAAHTIIYINLIRGTLYAVLPWDNAWEQLLSLFITGLLTPILVYWTYRLVAWLSPRMSQILSGGRG